jgi:hypothetical protein
MSALPFFKPSTSTSLQHLSNAALAAPFPATKLPLRIANALANSLCCCSLFSCSREGSSFDVLVNGQPALNLACSDFLGLGNDAGVQVRAAGNSAMFIGCFIFIIIIISSSSGGGSSSSRRTVASCMIKQHREQEKTTAMTRNGRAAYNHWQYKQRILAAVL